MIERRKYSRFNILAEVILLPISKKKLQESKISCVGYNLSQGGLGLISTKELKLEYDYITKIKNSSFVISGFLASESIIQSMPGVRQYGFQFHIPLKLIEIESLLRKIASGGSLEHWGIKSMSKSNI